MPINADLKAELHQVENCFRSQFQTVTERNNVLGKRIGEITTHMVENIHNHRQRQGLVIQYADVIQDLNYYYHVMLEYETSQINVDSDPFLRKERLLFAKMISNPDKLRKHLQMVNYLFIGRHDTPLVNHRSLIFQEMENNKQHVCSDRYKSALDHAYGSLASLQLQGYSTYIRAFNVLGVDSATLVRENEAKIINQKKYLEAATCNIMIPNSKSLENCIGGYYVYSGMKINVVCKDTFYMTGV